VNHQISIVHQYPLACPFSLDPKRKDIVFLQAVPDGLRDSLNLPVRISAADDEIVGE
jgi:hypothetical protein